jgi:hypothetical protein
MALLLVAAQDADKASEGVSVRAPAVAGAMAKVLAVAEAMAAAMVGKARQGDGRKQITSNYSGSKFHGSRFRGLWTNREPNNLCSYDNH